MLDIIIVSFAIVSNIQTVMYSTAKELDLVANWGHYSSHQDFYSNHYMGALVSDVLVVRFGLMKPSW